ncbi:glyoxalase [Flavobacterium sp. Sd200]|uniref:glyoxalase n=1 Tax=Flavobacterium sp. Sd200 TaxID=2692211 RepID=UPI00136EB004|nr:glyoxalase [Flavobacterium sp. Sd200]MXN92462.1 glyoxalase [Flavobacterium sp. Sd200]
MDHRDSGILSLREESIGAIHPQSSKEEIFQNKTLRPVIKLQSNLLAEAFVNYANKQKNYFYTLSVEKKLLYIENAIHKDIKFRNALKGMIIGMFTVDEFKEYTLNSSNLNKRMMNLVIDRLKDQVQVLVPETL